MCVCVCVLHSRYVDLVSQLNMFSKLWNLHELIVLVIVALLILCFIEPNDMYCIEVGCGI